MPLKLISQLGLEVLNQNANHASCTMKLTPHKCKEIRHQVVLKDARADLEWGTRTTPYAPNANGFLASVAVLDPSLKGCIHIHSGMWG